VTFLFTDIEGSTRLWDEHPDAMRAALERHDEILRSAFQAHGGYVFSTGGDGFGVAFARAGDALGAALASQAALASEPWPEGAVIRARMALHTGDVTERGGDYFGTPVNQTARLMALGHGGQVLCSGLTAGLVQAEVPLIDLGEHRLRDLSGPQRVIQAGAGTFPPLRSLDVFPSNLPAQMSAFVGGERHVRQVASMMEASRVVTLTGVGGVGKTRLAVQAAAELLPRYRDGAWLVELGPVVDPAALVEVIAGALQVPERQGQPLAAGVTGFLRGKQLLMVLDNCEHLLDTVAAFVAGVLAACPQVTVLATSRERLGADGERMFVVPSLDVPEEASTPDVVADADAVRLFVERAVEAKGSFELTAANAGAVARLVRRLDGIPLAIELAAARVRSLTPAELADRVDERFRLLAGGRRAGVERHQTLRRAIDWSYELLTEPEQVALNRAAVFAGDFGLNSAEAVIAGEPIDELEVVDLLGRLVDKSLVVAEDRGATTRYRLLETIHQYAQERLDAAGEGGAVGRLHAEHYAAFAVTAGDGLRGRDELAWTEQAEGELDNLRAALAWSVARGEADLALRIVVPPDVNGTRIQSATRAWAAPVVVMPGAQARPLYPEALAKASKGATATGDIGAGRRACRAALDAAEALGVDRRAQSRLLCWACYIASATGDTEEAGRMSKRCLEAARAAGDDWDLVQALSLRGGWLTTKGDAEAGTALSDEALTVARRLGNPTALCGAAIAAGVVRLETDADQALSLFAQGVEAAESVGNSFFIAMNLAFEAWIRARRGEWRRAAPLIARSLDLFYRSVTQSYFHRWVSPAMLILEAAGADEVSATLHGAAASAGMAMLPWRLAAEHMAASEQSLRGRLGDGRFDECATRGQAMDDDELADYVKKELEQVTAGADA